MADSEEKRTDLNQEFQEDQAMREMTFGEKVVGKSFNPSGDGKVNRLKELLAEAIDIVQNDTVGRMNPADYDLYGRGAIQQLLAGQMSAVKAVTKKD